MIQTTETTTTTTTTSHTIEKVQEEVGCHDSDTAASISDTTQEPASKNHQRPWGWAILVATALVAVAMVTITVVLVRQPRRTGTSTSGDGICPTVNASLLPFLGDGEATELHNVTWYYPTTVQEFGLDEACLACYTKACYTEDCHFDQLICSDGTGMIFGVYNNGTGICVAASMSHVCLQGSLNLSSLTPQQIKRSRDVILSDVADGINVSTEYLKDEFRLKCEVTGAI